MPGNGLRLNIDCGVYHTDARCPQRNIRTLFRRALFYGVFCISCHSFYFYWASAATDIPPEIDGYQSALLAGGSRRVIYAVVAALAQRGLLRADSSRGRLSPVAEKVQRSKNWDTIEEGVWLVLLRGPIRPSALHRICRSLTEPIAVKLREMGLVPEIKRARRNTEPEPARQRSAWRKQSTAHSK
jgi:uncharacterized protein (TIGR04222 family)